MQVPCLPQALPWLTLNSLLGPQFRGPPCQGPEVLPVPLSCPSLPSRVLAAPCCIVCLHQVVKSTGYRVRPSRICPQQMGMA